MSASHTRKYPLCHLSVRVPWHDSGWDGRVCANPSANTSCLVLKNIGMNRDDGREMNLRGKSLEVLADEADHPCCIGERGFFMSPFPFTRTKNHPYAESSPTTHAHFRPTTFSHPNYSADAIPFLWLLKENLEPLRNRYQIDLDLAREPELPFPTEWLQQRDNHAAILDCFYGHVRPEESLVFFYAKRTPLSEDPRRALVGVGTVRYISANREYGYVVPPADAPLRSLLWERLVQHSIRPDGEGGFQDGFLMPYQQALEHAATHPEFDPAGVVAYAPADRQAEFSYVSEHVTHDAAIGALLACAAALREAAKSLKGPWDRYQKWIDTELGRIWKLRGPFPGLGSALTAFGIELGVFVAYDLTRELGENEDPWPLVDAMFADPKSRLGTAAASQIGAEHRKMWKGIKSERKALLKLVSRFEVTPEQASLVYDDVQRRAAIPDLTDKQILENPYRLYEATRTTALPISLVTVDRGVFPEASVREKHFSPDDPSYLATGTDVRRIRAWAVSKLETAGSNGDTLLSRDEVIVAIRDDELRPSCAVTGDLMSVAESEFAPEIVPAALAGGHPAFQLARLSQCSQYIRQEVTKRRNGKPHVVQVDWGKLLDDLLKDAPADERDVHSRAEKVAALQVLAESRFSILIGPAGTGKTTLLAAFCSQETIRAGGVLLLAPTGKARVRMEQAAKKQKLDVTGRTIAGYLLDTGRYDPETGRYRMLPGSPRGKAADTVIVDETSMMTEEMLAATLEAVGGAKRIILVGDHRQLPPIGAGRPFVDLVRHLQPADVNRLVPRVGKCYAELTVNWRQSPDSTDARLASWFAGSDPGPGEDSFFAELASGTDPRFAIHSWSTAEECQKLIRDVLAKELKLNEPLDFDARLGATVSGGYSYFNRTTDRGGVRNTAETWQILSPIRAMQYGVVGINRQIHAEFRSKMVEFARSKHLKVMKPLGPEEIVYGDKVMCVKNQRRRWNTYPKEECAQQVANGEIGIAVGQFKSPKSGYKGYPWLLEVEFTSQPGFTYGFKAGDFGDEGDPILELAYALTVHKAQGSEFGTVILVLPNPCRLLSRELLYTALTRQKERIVVLLQGVPGDLRTYSRSDASETARRLTNLFETPEPVIVKDRRYDGKHIHRSARGEMMMSKSEVIIADALFARGIEYHYEKELTHGGRTCKPDFTIEDNASGITVYWEHCGMLRDPKYRDRWERKRDWYRDHGVLPLAESGGPNGTLIETSDDLETGFDSQAIAQIIGQVFGT